MNTTKPAKARENAGDHDVIGSKSCRKKITVKVLLSRIPDTCTAKRKKLQILRAQTKNVFFSFFRM